MINKTKSFKWEGNDLNNLLTLDIDELCRIYPDKTRSGLRGRRSEYMKKVRDHTEATRQVEISSNEFRKNPEVDEKKLSAFEDLLKRSNINPSDVGTIDRLSIWQTAFRDEDTGEMTTKDNYAMKLTPVKSEEESKREQWQAAAAKITFSKKKPIKRDHKVIYAYGDLQAGFREIINHKDNSREFIPLHDIAAMEVSRLICKDVAPDIIVNLSDSIDLASLSRFKRDSNHFNNELGMSFQAVHDHYAELRADNPYARIVEVASNHNQRLNDYILANFPQGYDLHRPNDSDDYAVLSYPYLTNLKHVNVEWIGGYPAGEFIYGEEYGKAPIAFRHGTETSSNGTTASKMMNTNPETHNVQGHSHGTNQAWHTTRKGEYVGSFAVGALCRTDGVVPSYWSAVGDDNRPVHHQEKWSQSVMIIKDYMNGEYEFTPVMIRKGIAYLHGKEYKSEL